MYFTEEWMNETITKKQETIINFNFYSIFTYHLLNKLKSNKNSNNSINSSNNIIIILIILITINNN